MDHCPRIHNLNYCWVLLISFLLRYDACFKFKPPYLLSSPLRAAISRFFPEQRHLEIPIGKNCRQRNLYISSHLNNPKTAFCSANHKSSQSSYLRVSPSCVELGGAQPSVTQFLLMGPAVSVEQLNIQVQNLKWEKSGDLQNSLSAQH